MGMVYAYKKGEMPNASDEVKKAAEGMSKKDAEKYASTKHAKLPEKVISDDFIPEVLDKKDVPHVKKLVKKLRDGSKTHAKQADELEVALKTKEKVDEAILPALMLAAKIGGGIMLAKKILDRKKKKKQEIIVRNEETAIESELLIQDWNKDDIKFTEVETVDIIKPKPLRPSSSNWREDLGEDWQKVNRKDKTDGLSKKAVKAYRRENPGSKLQTAVTTKPSKLKKGSKSAKRRLSFCRRMKGMKKKLTSAKTRRDPDSRINKALRRWNC
jgi:hypothetical protein